MSALSLADIIPEMAGLEDIFRSMEIAEEEILAAGGVKPEPGEEGSPLWRSFMLLRTTHPQMSTEFVYRAHCRELLARVKAGEDTRPGTDAEMALILMDISQATPIRSEAVGLQFRIFKRTFPEQYTKLFEDGGADADDYDKVHGTATDQAEVEAR